jgi:formylglycine-generating enzyme required for sulfatase activity
MPSTGRLLWTWLAAVATGTAVWFAGAGAGGEESNPPPYSDTDQPTVPEDSGSALPMRTGQFETPSPVDSLRKAKGRARRSGSRIGVGAPGDWVLIKAGSFMMGSPAGEPGRGRDEVQHHVTITRDFLLQATEVTRGQWREVMGNNPSFFGRCGTNCPVEKVTWFEAVAYANALSRREGLPECNRLTGCTKRPGQGMLCSSVQFEGLSCPGYRLPTEAEWEYAAPAGGRGSRYGHLQDIAWFFGNSNFSTHPVRLKRPNRPWYARAADRNGCTPDYRGSGIGLRLARSLP